MFGKVVVFTITERIELKNMLIFTLLGKYVLKDLLNNIVLILNFIPPEYFKTSSYAIN